MEKSSADAKAGEHAASIGTDTRGEQVTEVMEEPTANQPYHPGAGVGPSPAINRSCYPDFAAYQSTASAVPLPAPKGWASAPSAMAADADDTTPTDLIEIGGDQVPNARSKLAETEPRTHDRK